MEQIEVMGADGESLVYDGITVAKFKHHGKQEAARNPVSTFRQVQIKPRKRKGDAEQEYDVMLAMSAFFSLRVTESELPKLQRMLDLLEKG